ncbi:MAG: hypothetical protein V4548_06665 [Bacteroidota bacterium]
MPKEIELRSEEVQEILDKVPHWMIRWGSVVVLFILISFFFLSWLIKYPEVIHSQILITTNIPPEKLLAKTSGKIEAILVKDNTKVNPNTPLAIIENNANYQEVFLLKRIVENMKNSESKEFPFELLNNVQLGDIESAYSLFQSAYIADKLNRDLHPYLMENKAQQLENVQIKNRLDLLEQQKTINESELLLQKNDLNRIETLFYKGIIAAQEYENKKLVCLQAEKNYKSLLNNIS